MATLGQKGSFLGFTYNNIHSSTLGITRIISNRLTDNLIPSLKDITTNVDGKNGMAIWGAYYTKRVFTVSFAFQGLDECQFQLLQQFSQAKAIHDLIFDEAPYKVYSAKITGQAMFKHVVFDDGARYYNGEGSLTFTCYFPFARSRYAWQELYTLENIPEWREDDLDFDPLESGNLYYDFDVEQDAVGSLIGTESQFEWVAPESLLHNSSTYVGTDMNSNVGLYYKTTSKYRNYDDWIEASHIPSREHQGQWEDMGGYYTANLYNAGDIPMPTIWYFEIPLYGARSYSIMVGDRYLELANVSRIIDDSPTGAGGDRYIVIDMINQTIEGYDEYMRPTGRIYNKFISAGAFFGIPVGESLATVNVKPDEVKFTYLYL